VISLYHELMFVFFTGSVAMLVMVVT